MTAVIFLFFAFMAEIWVDKGQIIPYIILKIQEVRTENKYINNNLIKYKAY